MAMDVGGAKGGPKSDINVTPLVDVMLVLLIIMMLVAPMLQQGVSVKLPTAENTIDKPEQQGQTVLIKGDQDASYSSIMAAMDDLRKVGIEDIGLITERKNKPGATAGGK